jgi:hypothetical protein
MSEWSPWSSCSNAQGCGPGTINRTRTVVTPAEGCGTCRFPTIETDVCALDPCPQVTKPLPPLSFQYHLGLTTGVSTSRRSQSPVCETHAQPTSRFLMHAWQVSPSSTGSGSRVRSSGGWGGWAV